MSLKRILKWTVKTEPEVFTPIYEKMRPIMVERAIAFQSKHQAQITRIRNLIEQYITNPYLKMSYVSYGQRIAKIAEKYGGKAAIMAAVGELLLWKQRGLDEIMLISIAKLFNLDVTMWIPTLIERIGEGDVVASITETIVIDYVGPLAMISGWLDLSNMEDGDEVIIRLYVKTEEAGEYKLYSSDTFTGKQEAPALYLTPKLSAYGYRVTIQQTAGTPKAFHYFFARTA